MKTDGNRSDLKILLLTCTSLKEDSAGPPEPDPDVTYCYRLLYYLCRPIPNAAAYGLIQCRAYVSKEDCQTCAQKVVLEVIDCVPSTKATSEEVVALRWRHCVRNREPPPIVAAFQEVLALFELRCF
ncbi:unnamed protein product [Linum trigynum]|uniref:Uncharacterized protein n=1 Tax=Linum trigynum TaxID=586398 RepID=A0AAV2DSS8_9ROSI